MSRSFGFWRRDNARDRSYIYVCSACGKKAYFIPGGSRKHPKARTPKCEYKYCPYCGAYMVDGCDDKCIVALLADK